MSGTTERLWVSLVNSDRFRRIADSSIGVSVLESDATRRLSMARRYLTSYGHTVVNPARFKDVKICCVFIGHTKSGSSLLGSMLDAHRNAIIADGSDMLQYVPAGFSKEQLFHLLVKCSRREALKGRVTARRLTPYSFAVPDQWQGRYDRLQVIGDTTSETAIRRIAKDPRLIDNLRRMMKGVDVKFIQVIRNPFDPISAMRIRGKRTVENAVGHYFEACRMLADTRRHLNESNLLAVHYEDVVRRPEQNLRAVCGFLDLPYDDDYLKACSGILRDSPDQTRRLVPWEDRWIEEVERQIKQFDFLEGYSFDS
ncbi:MAG: sulfotransferase [Chloroflexota bacterium]|nr:sulfotransferase [Chloroflexota bacterium]